jgi:hypothetical protein
MVTLATYQSYRSVGKELMTTVMQQSLSKDALDRAAKALGIVEQGVLMFESEEEMAVLFDFALHDVRTGGKTAVEQYRDTTGVTSPIEAELLAAHASAATSLFRVIATNPAHNTLVLRDLLRRGQDVQLTDVNLSHTAIPGLLLFLRVVTVKEFATTSGVMFAFPGSLERRLLADYHRLVKKGAAAADARGRFVHFFKAYQAHGLGTRFE